MSRCNGHLPFLSAAIAALLTNQVTAKSRFLDVRHVTSSAVATQVHKTGASDKVRANSIANSRLSGPLDGAGWDTHQDGNFEPGGDQLLDRNFWTGQSMSLDYKYLDDLEPVAPEDAIVTAGGSGHVDGYVDALFLPPYLYPDAFPTVVGGGCNCTNGNSTHSAKCSCAKTTNTTDQPSYHWYRITPVFNSTNYTLGPADITYNEGDYWHPKVRGGIVAPSDRLPPKFYPVQAPEDRIRPLPATAREDRIGRKFARYIDEVDARQRECTTAKAGCTVPCKPGDKVNASIGNVKVQAQVLSVHVGGAMVVKAPITMTPHDSAGVECSVAMACTIFRPCYRPIGCVEKKDLNRRDAMGVLLNDLACPKDTQPCTSVQELVNENYARQGSKLCKVAAR